MLFVYYSLIEDQADQLRFEDIYHGYHKQMLFVANRILGNMNDAEDAVQDALLRIARNISSLRNRENWAVRGYVLTIAKNSALKMLTKKQQDDRIVRALNSDATDGDDILSHVLDSLDYELVLRAVRHLDPLYRQVLMLVYIQQQTPKEVADLLGRKEETVRKQLYRGRKLLLEFCKKEGLNYDHE